MDLLIGNNYTTFFLWLLPILNRVSLLLGEIMRYRPEDVIQCYTHRNFCDCGSRARLHVLTNGSIHYAKEVCENCDKRFKTIKNPKNNDKRKSIVHIKNINYCEICLRPFDKLGFKCVLHEHHILPYKTHPELDMEVANRLKLCTHCHGIVEIIRKMCRTGAYANK